MTALDVLLGPMLLGLTLNAVLMGSIIIQYFVYFTTSHTRDPTWIKITVAFLMLADTVNFGFDLAFVWMYTVTHFGDFAYIATSNWVFNTDPVMTVIISTTVQSFFAWRVNKLTGRRWLYILLNASAIVQFLCGLGTTIGCSIVKDFLKFQEFQVVVIIWLGLSAITDLAITFAMVQYLRSHRTGVAATEDVITKLVRFTVQTGAITTVWAVVDLIIYLSFANTLHLIFNMSLSKLYSNALLSSLNARSVWSGGDKSVGSGPLNGVTVVTTSTVHRDSFDLERQPRHHALDPRRISHIRAETDSRSYEKHHGDVIKLDVIPSPPSISSELDDITPQKA